MAKEVFYALIDTETTGLKPGFHEICEIATVLYGIEPDANGQLVERHRFESKIKVHHPERVQPQAAAINGYNEADWKDAQDFAAWRDWIKKCIPFGLAVPIGHNAPFDRAHIDEGYFKPLSIFCPLSYHMIDTVSIASVLRSRGYFKSDNLKLDTVCKALNIPMRQAHRAMSDAESCFEIFRKFMSLVPISK